MVNLWRFKMKKISSLVCFALVLLSLALLMSQSPQNSSQRAATSTSVKADFRLILVYADDEDQLQVIDKSGKANKIRIGEELMQGSTIVSQKTAAELELKATGTLLRINANSRMRFDQLPKKSGEQTLIGLLVGKIRIAAAKSTNSDPSLKIVTPTAAAGVRGTDFVMMVNPGLKDWICVQEGLVQFTKLATSKTVDVGPGLFAETYDAVFEAKPAGAERLAKIFGDVVFSSRKAIIQ